MHRLPELRAFRLMPQPCNGIAIAVPRGVEPKLFIGSMSTASRGTFRSSVAPTGKWATAKIRPRPGEGDARKPGRVPMVSSKPGHAVFDAGSVPFSCQPGRWTTPQPRSMREAS